MKVVQINGQNHLGSSRQMGRMVAEKLAEDAEITEFFLPRDLNHFCLGCYRCLSDEKDCPFYEEKARILQAIEEAQVLIFTTPTYCMRASAPMKAFIDLTFIHWLPHRPLKSNFSKRAVVVSSAAGAGARSAMGDIVTCLRYWGVPDIRTLGASVAATRWEEVSPKKKDAIGKKAEKIARKLRKAGPARAGLKTRFLFYLMRLGIKQQAASGSVLSGDAAYWQANGWLADKRPWK